MVLISGFNNMAFGF